MKTWRVIVTADCTASICLRARGETVEEAEVAARHSARHAARDAFAIDEGGPWDLYIGDPGSAECITEETEHEGEKVGLGDVKLLTKQAETIGEMLEDVDLTMTETEHLKGVWNFLHSILDAAARGGKEDKMWLVVH